MTGQHDGDEVSDPIEAELLREIATIATDPTEKGVERLLALSEDASTPAIVRIRAAATLLDIGFDPVEDGEPIVEDEP